MQRIAVWLTAGVLNATLGVVALFLLAPPLSAAACVLVTLANGARQAALTVLAAAAALTALSPVLRLAPLDAALYTVVSLGGAVAAAAFLRRARSLTLVVQLLTVLAIVLVLLIEVAGPEPDVLWAGVLENLRANMQASGVPIDFETEIRPYVPFMAAFFTSIAWFGLVIALYLGASVHAALPERGAPYGTFRDLNLGRVLAGVMVALSIAAMLTKSMIVINASMVMLVGFFVQGLAVCHWLIASRGLPPVLLLVLYLALLLTLGNVFLLLALVVLGYVDAWFRLRRALAPSAP